MLIRPVYHFAAAKLLLGGSHILLVRLVILVRLVLYFVLLTLAVRCRADGLR